MEIKNLRIKAVGNAYLKDLDQEVFFHFVFADYAGGEIIQQPEDGELVWLTSDEIGNLDNLLSEIKEILPHLFGGSDKVISYKAVYEKGNEMIDFNLDNPK